MWLSHWGIKVTHLYLQTSLPGPPTRSWLWWEETGRSRTLAALKAPPRCTCRGKGTKVGKKEMHPWVYAGVLGIAGVNEAATSAARSHLRALSTSARKPTGSAGFDMKASFLCREVDSLEAWWGNQRLVRPFGGEASWPAFPRRRDRLLGRNHRRCGLGWPGVRQRPLACGDTEEPSSLEGERGVFKSIKRDKNRR